MSGTFADEADHPSSMILWWPGGCGPVPIDHSNALRGRGERGKGAGLMGFWSRTFTWWNGATWGTLLFTRGHGREVGRDEDGNVYYQHKKNPKRRWVIYSGANDGSRVPPGWQAWLKGTIAELPDKALGPVRAFQQKPEPNLTGTMAAFRPDGSLSGKRARPASTGDYQPWTPD